LVVFDFLADMPVKMSYSARTNDIAVVFISQGEIKMINNIFYNELPNLNIL